MTAWDGDVMVWAPVEKKADSVPPVEEAGQAAEAPTGQADEAPAEQADAAEQADEAPAGEAEA